MSARRTRITARIVELLETIEPANGFKTRIGRNVFVGVVQGNQHEVPCIYLTPGRETTIEKRFGMSLVEREYTASAMVNRLDTTIDDYPENPRAEFAIVDALTSDIEQAIETPDATLAALIHDLRKDSVSPGYHEEGSELTGVALRFLVRYEMDKGDPDT